MNQPLNYEIDGTQYYYELDIHLNGIQLIKIIQYLILIDDMTICRMYDTMTYYDTLSYN